VGWVHTRSRCDVAQACSCELRTACHPPRLAARRPDLQCRQGKHMHSSFMHTFRDCYAICRKPALAGCLRKHGMRVLRATALQSRRTRGAAHPAGPQETPSTT
jgi:hypothetical protein